ncbi:hypothetical protein [Bosea lathyri]|uniref:Uncharacterized protein n=1 Tax=Bosea lathyri TaxID=1036778 RepID=A0A1H6ACE4_9HYPH|nr:hypothetical protein [Bosea lathyri]SEG45717.1 hypothetical protein SAMN04488115_105322 [Bosea lathyri]
MFEDIRSVAAAARAERVVEAKFRSQPKVREWPMTMVLGLLLLGLAFELQKGGSLTLGIGLASVSWILAEFATRLLRLGLPSIPLLLGFFAGSQFINLATLNETVTRVTEQRVAIAPGIDNYAALNVASVTLPTVIFLALYYWRFRVPLTIAVGVGYLLFGSLCLGLFFFEGAFVTWMEPLSWAGGVAVLGLAIRIDLSDRFRTTTRSEIAFWLYVLAAFIILNPIVGEFGKMTAMPALPSQAGLLGVLAALAICGLLIDRRILILGGALYSGLSLTYLAVKSELSGFGIPFVVLLTLFCILGLALYWRPLRQWLVLASPFRNLQHKLPPLTLESP